jgi:hypothetical protein
MSYLSTALNRLAERHGLKQADFIRDGTLTRSSVSRVFSGDQRNVSDEDFATLLKTFRDKQTQAELVVARCRDVLNGPGSELVDLAIRGHGPAEKKAVDFPDVELSHETEKAFAFLRSQCPINSELEKHLVGYAKLMGMK